jgi:hypothetical protein
MTGLLQFCRARDKGEAESERQRQDREHETRVRLRVQRQEARQESHRVEGHETRYNNVYSVTSGSENTREAGID